MPAYNYFPVTYPYQQNFMPQQYQQTQQIQQQPQVQIQPQQSGMLWVANELEAQNYPVAPNNAVALWDSSRPSVYLKQADASGRPIVKAYDLVERSGIAQKSDLQQEYKLTDFVKKSEFDALQEKIEILQADMKAIKKESVKKKREEAEDDE